MPHINDLIDSVVVNVAGNLNDVNQKQLRYYFQNGAPSFDIQDAEREFLILRGAAPVVGAELVANPNFTSGASWTPGAGWSISGDRARVDGTQVAFSNLQNTGLFQAAGNDYVSLEIESIEPTGALGLVVEDGATLETPEYTTRGLHRSLVSSAGAGPIILRAGPGVKAIVKLLSVRAITSINSGSFDTQDMWFYYLRTIKSLTGSLDDMKFQFWGPPNNGAP